MTRSQHPLIFYDKVTTSCILYIYCSEIQVNDSGDNNSHRDALDNQTGIITC